MYVCADLMNGANNKLKTMCVLVEEMAYKKKIYFSKSLNKQEMNLSHEIIFKFQQL